MSTGFEVRPISKDLPFGVVVSGLRQEDLGDPQTQEALRRHWIHDGVVVFRDLDGERAHVELSRVFGKLIGHPVQPQDPARREIFTIRHKPEDAFLTEVDGEVLGAWLPWHSDLVHVDSINHGGILRPLQLPTRGGETGFLDKISTYDAMPQRLKDKIEGRDIYYRFDRNPDNQIFGRTAKTRLMRLHAEARGYGDRKFPLVLHPMTYTQAETGRKMLNVSPWHSLGIAGLPKDEGDALLHEVMEYAIDPRFSYHHHWQMGEMVLWDNWRVLHSAAGCPPEEARWMERTTIEGDYGKGRLADGESIDDSMRIEV